MSKEEGPPSPHSDLPQYAEDLLEALLDLKTDSAYVRADFREAYEGEALTVTLMIKAPEFQWTVEFAFQEVPDSLNPSDLPNYEIIWRLKEDEPKE